MYTHMYVHISGFWFARKRLEPDLWDTMMLYRDYFKIHPDIIVRFTKESGSVIP